uniref:Variant surface glycoprotein n=1 Tax=Trypanosoma brucei TaxID=5691 RepID=A0A1V0FXZ1_9TRYP|nr:variant surface glycoprotein [Trypanosoma brucei]
MLITAARLLIALTLTAAQTRVNGDELSDANINGKISTPCDSAKLLQRTASIYGNELDKLANYAARNNQVKLMWQLGAATGGADSKLAYALLAALAEIKQAKAAHALVHNLGHFLKFKREIDIKTGILAHHAAGHATAADVVKTNAQSDFTNGASGAAGKAGVLTDLTLNTGNVCKENDAGKITTQGHTLSTALTKALYLTPDDDLKTLKYSTALKLACAGTTQQNWKASGADIGCTDSGNTPKLVLKLTPSELFQKTKAAEKQSIGKTDEDSKMCTGNYPEPASYWPTNQQIADANCQYNKNKQTPPAELASTTLASLKTDGDFKKLVRQTINDKSPTGTATSKAIDKIYGTDESAFKKTFITSIGDSTAKLWESRGLKDKKYSELSSANNLEAAYAQAVAQSIRNEVEKAKTLISKPKEMDCKNKVKADCNGECKWEGTDDKGECKPKDGEGQTNTATGDGTAAANAEGKKCSEKKTEGECKDGCKWEDNACKDSSILVNKQFALSVVSAAFVALLF